jgi:hypothetical protein
MSIRYLIERRGGLAGITANGIIDADTLSLDDRHALEQLIDSGARIDPDPGADRYTYVVTREAAFGKTTREIPESLLPEAVVRAVTTEI